MLIKITSLGRGILGYADRQEDKVLDYSSAGRDLGVLVDSKLNMSVPGSQEGQPYTKVHQTQHC